MLDKNKVIKQNKFFRLFATSNTVGLGDTSGLYHGTQQINQGQMDRWNIVTTLNYLSLDKEMEIILAKNKSYNNPKGKEKISNMIKVASLTRKGFIAGDISTVMVQGQFCIGQKMQKFLKTLVMLSELLF